MLGGHESKFIDAEFVIYRCNKFHHLVMKSLLIPTMISRSPRDVIRVLSRPSKTQDVNTSPLTSKQLYLRQNVKFSLSSSQSSQSKLTHSYFHAHSSRPLADLTVGGALEKTVEKFPDRECLVFCETGIKRTFSQFFKEVDQLAAGFVKLGLKKGDRVGIWGPSTLEWVLTQFATGRLGIILVNINPAYQADEVEFALNKVGCKALVSERSFKTQDYYKMISDIAPEIYHSPPGQLKSKRLPDLKTIVMMGVEQHPGTYRFDDVMNMGGPKEVNKVHELRHKLQFDDAINIQFTSGTTGFPKGATLTHHNIVNNAIYIGERMGFDVDADRILCQVPLYHCFGLVAGVLCMATHGVTNVFPVPGYDPAATVKALNDERCTTLYGTPTMFIDVTLQAENSKQKFPCLKKGVMAGSPCPPEVILKAEERLGCKIQVAYGSTETSPVVNLMFRDDPQDKRTTTVGRSLTNTECKIVDLEGNLVPVNTPGELLSRGYCVMLKYWGDEKKTKEAIDANGWYHSGDIAVMDEDGFTKLVGRIKDLIIRGGENIYPTEIEDFLHTHPMIDDVQVFGLPDSRLGEVIGAWIKLRNGESLTEEEVKSFCKGKISHFKIPEHIKFVEEFPLTITRKVQKYKMRENFTKELGLSGN